jgi:hypothetical protein
MDSTSQTVLMALLHTLLDKQCSWPVLETTTVSTTEILDSELQMKSAILAPYSLLTQFLMTFQTLHVNVTLSILQRYSGSTCYDGTKRHIEIGFQVESDFYKFMDVCFHDILYTTLYVQATIVSGIADYQSGFPRQSFIQDSFYLVGKSVNTIHTRITQREIISGLLGSTQLGNQYIDPTTDYYLARGHYSAKADFVYGFQQRATFHYVNVPPQ